MIQDAKNNLKLLCKYQEDLKIISAYIQDSLVAVKDIVFLKKNKIFIMMINRFMWENVPAYNKRIRCAVKFEEVLKVKSKKINQKKNNKHLECLAIKCREILNNNYEIKFFFAGDGIITLIAEAIEVVMHDIGKAWNVAHMPKHKI